MHRVSKIINAIANLVHDAAVKKGQKSSHRKSWRISHWQKDQDHESKSCWPSTFKWSFSCQVNRKKEAKQASFTKGFLPNVIHVYLVNREIITCLALLLIDPIQFFLLCFIQDSMNFPFRKRENWYLEYVSYWIARNCMRIYSWVFFLSNVHSIETVKSLYINFIIWFIL